MEPSRTQSSGRKWRLAAWALLSVAASGAAAREVRAESPPLAQKVATDLGLSEAEWQAVQKGAMVRTTPGDDSDRDLAVGLTFLARSPIDHIAHGFLRTVDLEADDTVAASGALRGDAPDLSRLKLAPGGDEEARRFLAAAPGEALNLSAAEIADFRKLGAGAGRAEVEAQLRRMLLSRYQSYRARGLAGMPPYQRAGEKERRPADELAHYPKMLEAHAPAFRRLLASYPEARPAGLEESYWWVVASQSGRPTVSLRHRMAMLQDGVLLASEREFYVSQGHNATQAIIGFVPVEQGTMVFYRAHASTDQVAGAGGGMKRGIGRNMMARQLERIFEKTRSRAATSAGGAP